MLKDFSKESFDIIVQAGQSNGEGTGFGDTDRPYEVNDKVWYLNGDFTITPAMELTAGNEILSNFSLSFAREYVKKGLLKEGRKLLILRSAVGGSGFLVHNWGMTDDLYLRMMEMIRTALELNKNNRLVGFLWHQGESDALHLAGFEVHYNNLMGLLQSVKDTFGVPDLPFIAADFVQQWKAANIEICIPIIDATRSVCKDCGKGAFVETDGLLSNVQEMTRSHPYGWVDDIHFSRHSLYLLGERYFEAYLELLKY